MPAACSRQDSSININGLLCPHQPCALHTHASARAQERRRFRAAKKEEDLGRGHHAAKDEDDSSKLISVLAQRVARHVLAAPGSPAARQSGSRAVVRSGSQAVRGASREQASSHSSCACSHRSRQCDRMCFRRLRRNSTLPVPENRWTNTRASRNGEQQ